MKRNKDQYDHWKSCHLDLSSCFVMLNHRLFVFQINLISSAKLPSPTDQANKPWLTYPYTWSQAKSKKCAKSTWYGRSGKYSNKLPTFYLASVCVVWVGCQSFHKQAFNNLITWHSDLTNKPGVDNLISRTKFTFC